MSEDLSLMVDDDGFVAVVSPDSYDAFVSEDWQLEDILDKFAASMSEGSLFVAYPGPDHAGDELTLADSPPAVVTREVSGVVDVGEGGLWLTDYAQLTMAAEFRDQKPVAQWSTRLPVDAGRYLVTLHEDGDGGSFVLTLSPALDAAAVEHQSVPWFE